MLNGIYAKNNVTLMLTIRQAVKNIFDKKERMASGRTKKTKNKKNEEEEEITRPCIASVHSNAGKLTKHFPAKR